MSWKKLTPSLAEHTNGNWVWKVGDRYEVWLRSNGYLRYAGITDSKEVAAQVAGENMLQVFRSGVVFQSLDEWLAKHESQ